jgi:hypothetical protein
LTWENNSRGAFFLLAIATILCRFLLIFVALGRYYHMNLGVGHVGIVVDTTSHFHFGENPPGFEWGIHGFDDGICGIVLGLHTHKESLI